MTESAGSFGLRSPGNRLVVDLTLGPDEGRGGRTSPFSGSSFASPFAGPSPSESPKGRRPQVPDPVGRPEKV